LVHTTCREKVVFVYEKEAKKIFEQDFGLEVRKSTDMSATPLLHGCGCMYTVTAGVA
jgi:hypothetical protein